MTRSLLLLCVFVLCVHVLGASDRDYVSEFKSIERYSLQTSISEGDWTKAGLEPAYHQYWKTYKDGIWVATDPWITERWSYDVFQGIDPDKIVSSDDVVNSTNEILKREGDKIQITKAYIVGMSYVGINREPIVYFPQLGGYYHNVPGVEGRFGEFLGTDFVDVINAIIRQRRDWGWKIEFDGSGRSMKSQKYKK